MSVAVQVSMYLDIYIGQCVWLGVQVSVWISVWASLWMHVQVSLWMDVYIICQFVDSVMVNLWWGIYIYMSVCGWVFRPF